MKAIHLLAVFAMFVAFATGAFALEPYNTSPQSDEELKRPAEDRNWEVCDISVTARLNAEKGWVYFNHKNDLKKALKFFDLALRQWPATPEAVLGKAYCLHAMNKKDKAVRVLAESKCKNQMTPDLIALTQIDLLVELKRYQEALQLSDLYAIAPLSENTLMGNFTPTFLELIPRAKVLLAMGDRDRATQIARKIFLWSSNNPYANKRALELYELCNVAPPPPPDTSAAKTKIHAILDSILTDASWTDREKLEKVLGRKLVLLKDSVYPTYGFIDTADGALISGTTLVLNNPNHDFTPSLWIGLNQMTIRISYRELKEWYPNLEFHPTTKQGCLVTAEYSDFTEHGNHVTTDGGSNDSNLITRVTITRQK